ncbi:MAG: hypothetical protein ABI864_05335 [Chloroflexota bacterium]
MDPAIKRYLDEHGATYTPEALRRGLLDAGYDPAEVDAALSGWNAAEASAPGAEGRRTFRNWARWLHIASLVAVFLLVVALKGPTAIGVALIGCAVLGVALVIGWLISSRIGRALLPHGGVFIALVVPAISAVLLGGSCFALLSSAISTPPRQGTVDLEILAPRAFEGSGAADCYTGGGLVGVQVSSQPLGALEGKQVSVSVNWYGNSPGDNPAPASNRDVSVQLIPASEADRPESFIKIFSTQFDEDVAPDALTGVIHFVGLVAEPTEGPATTPLGTISGTVSWDCR